MEEILEDKTPIYSKYFDDVLISPLIGKYLKNLQLEIDDLEKLLLLEDPRPLKNKLHKLKGAALIYGFPELSQLFEQIENANEGNQVDTMNRLRSYFERLILGYVN